MKKNRTASLRGDTNCKKETSIFKTMVDLVTKKIFLISLKAFESLLFSRINTVVDKIK